MSFSNSVRVPSDTHDSIHCGIHNVADGVVDNNTENASTLAMKLSVTPRTIQRDLAKLQKKGKIVHVGPDNGGH